MNFKLAEKIVSHLIALGTRTFCVCAGARNAPLVCLLEKVKGIEVVHFFDERSASFFALGRIQRDLNPVCVVTTSGTAVSECVSAAVEATYSGLPLVILSADRPRSYRGKGAPQSIEQIGIFSHYAQTTIDIEHPDEIVNTSLWTKNAPLHINVCFEEPLLDADVPELNANEIKKELFNEFKLNPGHSKTIKNPFIILGSLSESERPLVLEFLKNVSSPIYAESLSGVHGEKSIMHNLIESGDSTVQYIFENKLCDSILRIGGVPTLRFWRDLEVKFKNVPVVSCSSTDYSGLSRSSNHYLGLHCLQNINLSLNEEWVRTRQVIFKFDSEMRNKIENAFSLFPVAEQTLVRKLALSLQDHFIYVGNSLPIREFDFALDRNMRFDRVLGNRGANGIDGQISTYLGAALSVEQSSDYENWCIVGDLTAMCDLNSLWIAKKMKRSILRIVVINNKGGQIFNSMFGRDEFLNRHEINFEGWAKMWGFEYLKWEDIPSQMANLPNHCIIELLPDSAQSESFRTFLKK